MKNKLTIGKLAKLTGVGAETIRFYERRGLVNPPPRGSSGYRYYELDIIHRIHFIREVKELGFSLEDIREILTIGENEHESRGTCLEQARAIEEKIQRLITMRETLRHLRLGGDEQSEGSFLTVFKNMVIKNGGKHAIKG